MRIAVLEWICGGGLASQNSAEIASELLDEGQAMLRCLIKELCVAGFTVALPLDARLDQNNLLPSEHAECELIPNGASLEQVLQVWKSLAEAADWIIVIAPESNGILENAIACLADRFVHKLVNCRGKGLNLCCDKLKFAEFCEQAGIAHPPTRLVSHVDNAWLERTARQFGNREWAIKPIDGAGCESLLRLSSPQLSARMSDLNAEPPNTLLVQPWMAGQALSCACIVDRDSHWHWLPLQEQLLTEGAQPKYLGGRFACMAESDHPAQLLNHLATQLEQQFPGDFRGWLGVDLVFDANAVPGQRWTVIEINPRCTTSLVGLAEAYRGSNRSENLIGSLIRWQLDSEMTLGGIWTPIAFSANGTTRDIQEVCAQSEWSADQS